MPPAPARSAPHPAPATRPARRRRLAPEERLPQILEAALAEFAERGYAGASMAAAAARAGIAKGLIYHYVPGKAELFRAVVRSCLQPAFAEAEGLIAGFQGGNRTTLLERLIEATAPHIVFEVDVLWVAVGGGETQDLLERFGERIRLLHVKDRGTGEQDAPFGEGLLPWDETLPAARNAAVEWYIVEQDVCQRPPLESVRISLDNLRNMGIA
jgi:AcrR family transcriptional regulator